MWFFSAKTHCSTLKKTPVFLHLLKYVISRGKPQSGIFAAFVMSNWSLDQAAKSSHYGSAFSTRIG